MENTKELSGPTNTANVGSLDNLITPPETKILGLHLFPDSLITKLPELYKSVVEAHRNASDRTAVLFCLLVLCSGTFPNIYFRYKKKYWLNLLGYFIAPPATGKGNASTVRKILDLIQNQYLKQAEEALEKYRVELSEWKKTKGNNKGPEPIKPKCPCFIFPDDSTKPKLLENLSHSKGRGIILGQETDTSTKANNGEHGGFSDYWRKAAEHETIAKGTKQDGNIEIPNPQLAILLTSTPGQLTGMVKGLEDGLTSRTAFLYWPNAQGYVLQDQFNGLTISDLDFDNQILEAGKQVESWYWLLLNGNTEYQWEFSKQQEYQCNAFVKRCNSDIKNVLQAPTGSDKRSPQILLRIAVQLDVLFLMANGEELKSKRICSDHAFNLAVEIMEVLWLNTMEALNFLAGAAQSKNQPITPQEREKVMQLLAEGLSNRQVSEAIWGHQNKRDTVGKIRKATQDAIKGSGNTEPD